MASSIRKTIELLDKFFASIDFADSKGNVKCLYNKIQQADLSKTGACMDNIQLAYDNFMSRGN